MLEPGFTFVPKAVGELRSPRKERIVRATFSPGGRLLAATTDAGQILVWRWDGEGYSLSAESKTIDGGSVKPLCLGWSSRASLLITGWSDGLLRVYDSKTLALVRQSEDGSGGAVLCLAVHPHSAVFVSAAEGEGGLRVWNAARKRLQPIQEVSGPEQQTWGLSWHLRGGLLASCGADERVRIWQYEDRSDKLTESQHIVSQARQVVWSPDADPLLAHIEPAGCLKLWRTRQRGAVTLPHSGEVTSVVFSPDGSVCISKSSTGQLLLWRSPSGEFLEYIEERKITSIEPGGPPFPAELAVRSVQARPDWNTEERSVAPSVTLAFDLVNADPSDLCLRIWRLRREERESQPPPPRVRDYVVTYPQPGTQTVVQESIRFSGLQDQKAREDQLGFKPYVEAVADFLTDAGTRPPLTFSIEGEWGAGKSSFMEQVRQRIEDREAGNRKGPRSRFQRLWRGNQSHILSFNLWRHDKEESVWAAFVLELLQQLRRQCGLPRRLLGWANLFVWRLQWTNALFGFLRLAAWLIIIVLGAIVVSNLPTQTLRPTQTPTAVDDSTKIQEVIDSIGDALDSPESLAVLVLVVTLLLNAKQLLGNPLDLEIGKYLRSSDWENRTAFVERFHKDFDQIVQAYAGKKRVYVFVDDLDRCDVPRAADLMQAINLLISENPNLLFILGMDRQKVAAGLAVKFAKILPYLRTEAVPQGYGPAEGLVYGYEFIEKFIQIPFQLPRPSRADLTRFLRSLSPSADTGAPTDLIDPGQEEPEWSEDLDQPTLPPMPHPAQDPTGPGSSMHSLPADRTVPAQLPTREELSLAIGFDSGIVRETVLLVAPALGNNPRRIKQFINSFRLRAFLAYHTGLLAGRESHPDKVTFYQLGKLVVLSLRWPLLLAELHERPNLLRKLEAAATDPTYLPGDSEKRWTNQPRLMALLRSRSSSPHKNLASLDVKLLLRIS